MGTGRFIATNLEPLIKRQGILMSALAKEVGKSPATITRYAKGDRTVAQEDAQRIADFFRIPFHMIFTEVDK